MAKCLQPMATKMNLRRHSSIFVIFTILVNSTPESLAIVGIYNSQHEAFLCNQDSETNIFCNLNEKSTILEDLFRYNGQFTNIISPHVSVQASEGLFNVVLKNAVIFRHVLAFFMLADGTNVDIEVVNTSTKFIIACVSHRSYSRVSSNIFKPPLSPKAAMKQIYYRNKWHPYVQTTFNLNINEEHLQSGHFTCSSVDDRDQAETIQIFTRSAASSETSPFVPVRELTTRSDDASHAFIVPCRTNYRLETPPDLLWSQHDQDHLSMITTEEMKSFIWDPSVGFRFNSSKKAWEMKTLACRLGHYEKVFLPTPGRFMNLYVVKVNENKISCELGQRNDSTQHLLRSELNLIEKRYHMCLPDTSCDLEWELGILESDRIFKETVDVSPMWYFGIFSCSFEHIYDNIRIPETNFQKFFEGLDSKIYLLPGSYPNSSVIQITQVKRPFYKSRAELYHNFTCTVIDFVQSLASPQIEFIIRLKDNTEIVFLQELTRRPGQSSSVARFNPALHSNITHFICRTVTNEGKFVSAESHLQIIDVFAPVIDNNVETYKMTFQVGDLSDNHTLICPITGAPPPNYQWTFDEKNTKLVTGTNTSILKFRQIHEDLVGSYTCRAWNDHGNSSFEFQVSVQPQGFFSTLNRTTVAWIAFGTIVGLIGLGGTMVSALKYLRAKQQMRNLTTEEALEFLNGIPTSEERPHSQQGDGSELALRLPFTKRIEPNVLIVARDLVLGKGQFGIVYRGFLRNEAVAVKAFKRAVTCDEFRAALVEVKLMGFVGEHPNIIRFIGADVTNIEKRDILIVMEVSPFGSLEKHLRKLKTSTRPSYENTASLCTTADEKLMHQKLFGFCEQIVFAMEHLESKNVIHGDLAARNVLVFDHDVVKVTDFGYSRQLYENSMYKPRKNRALPWRSASIELLRQMEFSTESDIWAFGVTVWEIFTFGNVPFAGVRYSDQFVKSLEEGMRLEKPAALCESQYAFLMECWNMDKSRRPRFSVLKSFFSVESF